jgi:GrpB-like predicted nucleotidyltransferase (UPF0157 family)
MKFIEQSEYLPRIDAIFNELHENLLSISPNLRVEHIGSSSIPGAVSKGDLDIFIGVTQEEFNRTIQLLESIGFYEKTDTLRTESLRMMVTDSYEEDVAVQLVANGSEHESFLEFRDKLRSNPDLVSRYNQLKFDCKGLAHDNYREVKSAFIETVLKTH